MIRRGRTIDPPCIFFWLCLSSHRSTDRQMYALRGGIGSKRRRFCSIRSAMSVIISNRGSTDLSRRCDPSVRALRHLRQTLLCGKKPDGGRN